MTTNEEKLVQMLEAIVNRATRPRPDGNSGYFLQSVRSGLIDDARELLEQVKTDSK